MMHQILRSIREGDFRSLARGISFVENGVPGYEAIMRNLDFEKSQPIIGITGPPGAGKSTLVDAMISHLVHLNKSVGVICVDPSSPFRHGALLGDRIRMREWYNHPSVFIRSLASRGTLGGLHPRIIEITELMKQAPFDYLFIETVGVGQSEVEIAGLADVTVVVLVPEGGDDVQTMKAGLMEAGDLFVVNKADRPGADLFLKNLRQALYPVKKNGNDIPVIKTTATEKQGINELFSAISHLLGNHRNNPEQLLLLTEKAYLLIQEKRMRGIKREIILKEIEKAISANNFNLYRFAEDFNVKDSFT